MLLAIIVLLRASCLITTHNLLWIIIRWYDRRTICSRGRTLNTKTAENHHGDQNRFCVEREACLHSTHGGIMMISYMTRDATQRAVHRVHILKGLLEKLEEGIANKDYCVDLLNQSLAVQRALKSLDAYLLDQHLNSCVKAHMMKGKESEQLRKELLEIYKLSRKN